MKESSRHSNPKVAIQGQTGSFHDEAATQWFHKSLNLLCYDSFSEVFAAVESGDADYGVCAVENSLAGSINEVYDLLLSSEVTIVGEYYLAVQQCLIGNTETTIDSIKSIYSHPVALAQCRNYLDKFLPHAQRLEYYDTAGSVEYVKSLGRSDTAAIAGQRAAELYGMHVIAQNIQDEDSNATRFLILAKVVSANHQAANKTSLVLRTSHQPGALYNALGAFAKQSVNLTKLQSRPIPKEPWRYMFYVDVAAGAEQSGLQAALQELRRQDCDYSVLGSYKSANIGYSAK